MNVVCRPLAARRARLVALGGLLAGLVGPRSATAESLAVDRAWADGSRWEHHDRFAGMPDTWVYVPDGMSRRAPEARGAVIHLMGCGQMTFQIAQAAGWPEAAEAYGLVVVIPGIVAPAHPNRDAPNVECFNYGYDGGFGIYRPTRDDPDQAALIALGQALSEDPALAELRVDPDQIYIAGTSAGGATAMEVACMAPDIFAGVATAAAPGIGTAQGAAVMPPRFGFSAQSVAEQCRGYAQASGDERALQLLAAQVHAIVSDDNGLPAGAGPGDTSKFYDQTVWDGDKFCPHVYNEVRAEALTDLLGLERQPSHAAVAIAEGVGMGCPGGERSRDDAGEVQCQINRSVDRPWTALADLWTDAAGRTRLVRIEQDTLRHAWPAGPPGPGDHPATPTRDELRRDGYMDPATGEFSRDRMNAAPNGTYGAIYLNERAMDFPMFVAELWTDNNPRLSPAPGEPAPEAGSDPEVLVVSADTPRTGCLAAQGEASDPDGDLASVAVSVLGVGPRPASLGGDGTWSFELCDLPAGAYEIVAFALDDAGRRSTPSDGLVIDVPGPGGDSESVEGTLTDHANAGRVVRFTAVYFEYRQRYCVYENWLWHCEPFSLRRCSPDDDWTDGDPGCPSPAPDSASLTVAIRLSPEGPVEVGDELTITVQVGNDGPDPGSATFARVALPPSLSALPAGRCEALGAGEIICHLGPLAVGQSSIASLSAQALTAGDATLVVTAAGPQSGRPPMAQTTLRIDSAPVPEPVPDPPADPAGEQLPQPGAESVPPPEANPGPTQRPDVPPQIAAPGADAGDSLCEGHDDQAHGLATTPHDKPVGGCAVSGIGRTAPGPSLLLLALALAFISGRRGPTSPAGAGRRPCSRRRTARPPRPGPGSNRTAPRRSSRGRARTPQRRGSGASAHDAIRRGRGPSRARPGEAPARRGSTSPPGPRAPCGTVVRGPSRERSSPLRGAKPDGGWRTARHRRSRRRRGRAGRTDRPPPAGLRLARRWPRVAQVARSSFAGRHRIRARKSPPGTCRRRCPRPTSLVLRGRWCRRRRTRGRPKLVRSNSWVGSRRVGAVRAYAA